MRRGPGSRLRCRLKRVSSESSRYVDAREFTSSSTAAIASATSVARSAGRAGTTTSKVVPMVDPEKVRAPGCSPGARR